MNLDWGYFILGLSMIGSIANIYKKKWCFIVWLITNFSWVVYNWNISKPQVLLNLFYMGLTLWGLIIWTRDDIIKKKKLEDNIAN